MALRGINMPLALTGEETVWYDVYSQLGLNDTEINNFLSGPAFLSWQRMGNLQKWGGPMTASWRRSRPRCKFVYSLTCGPGHVARSRWIQWLCAGGAETHYPSADIRPSGAWSSFPPEYVRDDLLQPTDPLFQQIGTAFIQTQTKRYGTNHLYNTDTYNRIVR